MVKRNRSRERARATGPGFVQHPPDAVTRIHTTLEAEALAQWLLQPDRPWPVVVVSTAAESSNPYVDVERLKSDVGDLAEVAVIPTGDVSWSFSSTMPPMTQVYGGASRVYAVDNDWVDDPHRSPLRFAYSSDDDERVRAKLARDALTSAIRAGGFAAGAVPGAVAASGVVRGIVGTRAFVTLDDGADATVWEELTAEDIPLGHILAAGMRVHGEYDPDTRRFDLRQAMAEAASATLADIGGPGDLVLARVGAVSAHSTTLFPTPSLPVIVPRELITGNLLDDPADLFTVGEVVVARVCDDGAGLRLDDISDVDEPTNPAPSLLPGGPPWLSLSAAPTRVAPQAPEPQPRRGAPGPPAATGTAAAPTSGTRIPTPGELAGSAPVAEPAPIAVAEPARVAVPLHAGHKTDNGLSTYAESSSPTPRDLATRGVSPALQNRPSPTRVADEPASESQRRALREVTGLLHAERGRVTQLSRELTVLRAMDRARAVELAELRRRAADLESDLSTATGRIEEQKTRYRRADRARQLAQKEVRSLRASEENRAAELYGEEAFLDPGDQFRHEVYLEWTRLVPATQKDAKPLPEYTMGEAFLASLDALEGVNRSKVLRVVVEVLTGDARHIPGRDVHRLRRGAGGDDAYVTRPDDGAQAWRAALQRNTPGARRLHYWQLPGGGVELSRVVLHDDMEP